MLAPFMLAFVYIPAALGGILCLQVIRRLPGKRLHVLVVAGLLVVAGGVWLAWSALFRPESDLLTPAWFQDTLGRLQLTEHRLLPSWWLSEGLLESASGRWSEGVLFLTLMISNALFCRAGGWLDGGTDLSGRL